MKNAGFYVERAVGGAGQWEKLGFVDGAGTTSDPQSYQFVDQRLPYGEERVTYRLTQVDFDGAEERSPEVEVQLGAPERLTLSAPFPNPLTRQARVRYALPTEGAVEIAVYDVLGRQAATWVDRNQPAGRYETVISTRGLSSGVYFLRLKTDRGIRTQKLTVVR